MGKPMYVKHTYLYAVGYIAWEPCEVKHLSSMWNINQTEIPLVVASESGKIRNVKVKIQSEK